MRQANLIIVALVMMSPFAANADFIYAPGGSDITEGDSRNSVPLSCCLFSDRYQQIYDASLFSSISAPVRIGAIAFRLDAGEATSASGSFSSLRINLTTTSASTSVYSNRFADNYGADLATVFDGSLSWTATSGGSPNAFDLVISFDTEFIYDPRDGNLLFEWRDFGGDTTPMERFFDAAFTPNMTRLVNAFDGVDAEYADENLSTRGYGLVTRFTVTSIPEPGTLALLGAGLAGAGLARRRKMT